MADPAYRDGFSSSAPPPPLPRPFPVYGLMALVITLGIVLIFVHGIAVKGWGSCATGLSFLLPVMFLGPIHVGFGVGFGIASLRRRERKRGVAIIAILLGSYPLLMLALAWMVALVESIF